MGFVGAYDNEKDAAQTYDLAALKYWGGETMLNFPVSWIFILLILNWYNLPTKCTRPNKKSEC